MEAADERSGNRFGNASETIAELRDQQSRLRGEFDRLLKEHQELIERIGENNRKPAEEKSADKDGSGKRGGKDQTGQNGGKDKPKDKDNQGDQDKQGDKQKQQDKKPKPPLTTRIRNWAGAHPLIILAGAVLFLCVLVGGYFLWRYIESYESTDDAQVDGHTDPISPRITGTVVGVYVENTQSVKKGQVLVDLDPRDYQVAVENARAAFAQAQSSLKAQDPNLPITRTTQRTAVETAAQQTYESARADLAQAEATAANAAAERDRYGLLVEKQEVSREVYDRWATEARADEALVSARRSSAEAARRTVEQRQAALGETRQRADEVRANEPRQVAVQHATTEERRASVLSAQARLNQALLNLSYCKIVAPTDGIIGDKTVEIGSQLQTGQEMFSISETADIWVTANFKETSIRRMRPGQSVSIHVDALSQAFEGYVVNLPGATGAKYSLLPPENATGNYVKVVQRLPVRIRFRRGQPNEDRLRPGMSVEPKVWVE